MAWNDVEWANGDLVAELKLDRMHENTEFVRDQIEGRLIASLDEVRDGYGSYSSAPTNTPKAKLEVKSGVSVLDSKEWTGATSLVESKIVDIDVSGFTDNAIASIELEMTAAVDADAYVAPGGIQQIRFFKTVDTERLSLFFRFRLFSEYNFFYTTYQWAASASGIIVLAHRVDRGW